MVKAPEVEVDIAEREDWIRKLRARSIEEETKLPKAAEEEKKTSVKKEKATKTTEKEFDVLSFINNRIEDARKALIDFDLERAKLIYIELLDIYNKLSDDKKIKVYEAIRELYDERMNAERITKAR